MRQASLFRVPAIIRFGENAAQYIGAEILNLGCSKPLLVTDKFLLDSGILDPVLHSLKKHNISPVIYDGVRAEPGMNVVNEGLALLRHHCCDSLISCGGGSPIDTAKAIATLATNKGCMRDFMGIDNVALPCLPHIAVPTTAGTGSEATPTTIITDEEQNVKMLIISGKLIPQVAVVDPLLTLQMPQSITAGTGVDALVHAVEAYVSVKANCMSDDFALSAISLLGKSLLQAWSNPTNVTARGDVMLGALKAGIAFANSSVALVHGMSRPIGAVFHVPHGISNATLFAAVTRFSIPGAPERYRDVAKAFGLNVEGLHPLQAAECAASFIEQIVHTLNVPSLSGLGISKESLDENVEKMARDAIASGSPCNNPRQASEKEIIELYYAAF